MYLECAGRKPLESLSMKASHLDCHLQSFSFCSIVYCQEIYVLRVAYLIRCLVGQIDKDARSRHRRFECATSCNLQLILICLIPYNRTHSSLMSTIPTYNASEPWGGNTLEVDVNLQYTGLEYHYIYLILCAIIVWPILPGIGLLYGGLASRKSALTLLLQSFLVGAVITIQWMLWGYSLAYSRTAGPFIGDTSMFLMRGVMAAPSPGNAMIPDIVFCFYQLLFW